MTYQSEYIVSESKAAYGGGSEIDSGAEGVPGSSNVPHSAQNPGVQPSGIGDPAWGAGPEDDSSPSYASDPWRQQAGG